jgi:hypothetical protein
MLLSEMFGVERDTDFKVKGYESRFRLTLNVDGFERLKIKHPGIDMWGTPLAETIFNVISVAPAGIIHLPPPLTDEQREQLKAIWTLGGRWLAKDASGSVVFCYQARPEKAVIEWTVRDVNDEFMEITHFVPAVAGLVSWSDPEPFDIGKALGVEE